MSLEDVAFNAYSLQFDFLFVISNFLGYRL